MDVLLGQGHPIDLIVKYFASDGVTLNFSKYIYVEYGRTLERTMFSEKSGAVGSFWLEYQLKALRKSEELAFHSKVGKHGNEYHFPIIDFVGRHDVDELRKAFLAVFPDWDSVLHIFDSGRSYHGYIPQLLKKSEWIAFLGKLLLVNPPPHRGGPIVDARWIGHSIVNQFSALRWSWNTSMYLGIPRGDNL